MAHMLCIYSEVSVVLVWFEYGVSVCVCVCVCVWLDIVQATAPLSGYAVMCVGVVFVRGWCAAVSPFAIHFALHCERRRL
jgi:hypothetical protein